MRKLEWIVWGVLGTVMLVILGLFIAKQREERRPELPLISQAPDFTLTNQLGQKVTLADLKGNIWVGCIIFTSCPGPCPKMAQVTSALQGKLDPKWPVKLVTLTTDPATDTPETLKRFGQRFGADPEKWWFLTGAKEEIARLAIDGLKLTAIPKEERDRTSVNDLFIHSTIFVIVDRDGVMRATVESLEPGAVDKSLDYIRQLLRS